MTQTSAPQDGFFAAVLARTKAVFLAHYDKLLTTVLAALCGWGAVYATAWIGALPQQVPPAPAVVREDPTAARLAAVETALERLRQEIAAGRSGGKKAKP